MSLQLEQPAPDFSLYNSEKELVTLSSFKGQKVVLLFFPFAFTGTCTKELCSVRDNLSYYNDLNVKVLAISVDSPYTLAKYKEDQGFNFMLLSDFNKEVSTLYHSIYSVFNLDLRGVSKRSAFVIDSLGILKHIEVLEKAGDIPDFDKIKSVLQTIH